MDNPDFTGWTREEKVKYAEKRMSEMRLKNERMQRRHAEVEFDRIAAENKNSSVTNSTKIQKQEKYFVPKDQEMVKDVTRYAREWDKGKNDNDDWDSHSHKAFKNYRTSYHERKKNYKNDTWTSYRDEKNDQYRQDYVSDSNQNKKSRRNYKSHSNDHYSMPHYHDNSSKQSRGSRYRSSEPCRKSQQSHEKYKKTHFPSDSRRQHNKYYSSSTSTDSEYKDNKVNKIQSNKEASTLYYNDRLSEDQHKLARTHKWVQSVQESSLEQENVSEDTEQKNASPKRKYETSSNKCLNENVPISGKNKSRQISKLKSQRLDYNEDKGNTTRESKTMQHKSSEEFKNTNRRSYTKFERYDHSNESSEDSISSIPLNKNKSEENLQSDRTYYNEKENNNSENVESKCNLKSLNLGSEESKGKNRETSNVNRRFVESNSACKSPSYNTGSYASKKGFNNSGFSVARKVSSHTVSHSFPSETTYNNTGFNFTNEKFFKKGFQTKRSPQYNSPDSYKNEHFSKQRKFDKVQSENDSWDSANITRSMKNEKYNPNKKKSRFHATDSVNKDATGWGSIPQAFDQGADGWGSNEDDDDGVWGSAEQSGKNWKINEEDKEKNQKSKFVPDSHDTSIVDNRNEKIFKVKNPTASDDGGWSTVEEGEIRSDDESIEDKKQVK